MAYPAATRAGVEILRHQYRFSAVDQHSRQAGVGALAGLHHADGAKAMRIQIACKVAQHRVGVFMVVIDQGGKVALGVEHDTPLVGLI